MPYSPFTFQDALQQRVSTDHARAQNRLIDYKLKQEQLEGNRADTLRDIYSRGEQPTSAQIGAYRPDLAISQQENNFETDKEKHAIVIGVAKAIKQRQDNSGFQPGSPEYMDLFNKNMDSIKPYMAKLIGQPDIVNKPNDLNAIMTLASMNDKAGAVKDNYVMIYDRQGNPHRFNKATGLVEDVDGMEGSAQYSPQAIADRKRALEGETGVTVKDSEDRDVRVPQKAIPAFGSDTLGRAEHIMLNGIIPVESGGTRDPTNATNPQSTANGPAQVLRGPGQDFGHGMPPYPENGTGAEKKAWSVVAMSHLVNKYNDDEKAKQAWHDGQGHVDRGLPDKTNYVEKVNNRLGVGPSLAEKEQIKSDIAVNEANQKKINEQKSEMTDPVKIRERKNVNVMLDAMEKDYEKLLKMNEVTDPEKSTLNNLLISAKTSAPGQYISKAAATKAQAVRNDVLAKQPLLIQAISKASGKSSTQLNSEFELQNFMKAVTDPGMDIQSIRTQMKTLRDLYGAGNSDKEEDIFSKANAILEGK